MKKFLVLPVVLVALLIIGVAGVLGFRYAVSPPSDDKTAIAFTVSKGESVAQIADHLTSEGLVRNSLIYRLFVRFSGFESRLQAGKFKLAKNLSMKDLTYELARGTTDQAATILEGWRIEEIAEYFDKKQIVSREEFLEAAGSNRFNYDFLPTYTGLDQPYRRLEGYLFPDTYQIAAQSSGESIIRILLKNFEARLGQSVRADAAKTKLSLAEVVRLASIVEREVHQESERPTVAGILLKRLQTPGWRLQADATTQYAVGREGSWWPKLQQNAREIAPESLYNTYAHDGLPPTPISNPGLSALKAVIYSKASDYWYYVSGKEGTVHYAKTLDEQNENTRKFVF